MIAYCDTERPSDCLMSLAANAKGIGLHFLHGASLPDPRKILQGSGSQNRFVRLASAASLSSVPVQELLAAASARADPPFPSSGGGKLIVRSISAKQRPRK